jgi:hypothetical protein
VTRSVAIVTGVGSTVPFHMKDVVLPAVSIYLLKQDVVRAAAPASGQRAMPHSIRSN